MFVPPGVCLSGSTFHSFPLCSGPQHAHLHRLHSWAPLSSDLQFILTKGCHQHWGWEVDNALVLCVSVSLLPLLGLWQPSVAGLLFTSGPGETFKHPHLSSGEKSASGQSGFCSLCPQNSQLTTSFWFHRHVSHHSHYAQQTHRGLYLKDNLISQHGWGEG